jgi:hypothetical protein
MDHSQLRALTLRREQIDILLRGYAEES